MKMNESKKKTLALLSIALAVVIAVGATLAYLATKTGEVSNMFTFADNIRAKLEEPNWNPQEGGSLIPGYEVKKDPIITNISDNGVNEFAAIKVSFTDGVGNKLDSTAAGRLLGMLEITWNSDWALKSGTLTDAEQVYIYNQSLTPGQVSSPVFSSVKIKSDISDEDYAWLSGIIMDHTDECYTFGVHDDAECTITYKHHVNCAIHGEDDAEITPKGGSIGGVSCDCTPAEQHEADCPILIGTLTGTCSHIADADSISGFQIKVQGAVVQADVDGMTTWDNSATIANLLSLFGITTP